LNYCLITINGSIPSFAGLPQFVLCGCAQSSLYVPANLRVFPEHIFRLFPLLVSSLLVLRCLAFLCVLGPTSLLPLACFSSLGLSLLVLFFHWSALVSGGSCLLVVQGATPSHWSFRAWLLCIATRPKCEKLSSSPIAFFPTALLRSRPFSLYWGVL